MEIFYAILIGIRRKLKPAVILLHETKNHVGGHLHPEYGEPLRAPKVPNETKDILAGALLQSGLSAFQSPSGG
jgi:hypothetical protein